MSGDSLIKSIKKSGSDNLKAVFSTVPILGSIFSYYDTKYSLDRLERFINSIQEKLNQFEITHNEEKKKYISALGIKVFEGVQEDILEEKHELFKDFLLGTLKSPPSNSQEYSLKIFFSDYLKSLTIEHIKILKYLKPTRSSSNQGTRYQNFDEISISTELDLLLVEALIIKLKSQGLIEPSTEWDDTKDEKITISNLGISFLESIEHQNSVNGSGFTIHS